jgi:uncharacterized protein YndB with AHSA1/START domain
MLKKAFVVVIVLVATFLLFVAMQPSEFCIQRSIVIAAPAEKIFPYINDLHKHGLWSPWEKLDPSMKKTFAGSPSGIGSIYSWEGTDKVGVGSMTIVDSQPNKKVSMNLEFLKPFKAANHVEFAFKPQAEGTAVSWSMSGHKQFLQKIFCSFMNMDKMVGSEFEKGLAQLKTVVESSLKS